MVWRNMSSGGVGALKPIGSRAIYQDILENFMLQFAAAKAAWVSILISSVLLCFDVIIYANKYWEHI